MMGVFQDLRLEYPISPGSATESLKSSTLLHLANTHMEGAMVSFLSSDLVILGED